jgi:4,5-DOPA dioxygenase extradiol
VTRLPSLFVSHGAPTLVFDLESPSYNALADLAEKLPAEPRGIVVVSAHWRTEAPRLTSAAEPETLHDFHGFPPGCYDLFYVVEGAPELAARTRGLLAEAGLAAELDGERGLDHGAWVPLMLAFPAGDVPVCELSLPATDDPAASLALGRALAPLRDDGILIVGSGGSVHNLEHWRPGGDGAADWARAFDDRLAEAVHAGDEAALLSLPASPEGRRAHPGVEHYLPLLVAFGAAGAGARGHDIFRGFIDGDLGMSLFGFD